MALQSVEKVARISVGIVVVGLALYAADIATRDCSVGPYLYDNCMWTALRTRLGLPASRLLRIATLEFVGVALASLLYLTFRHLFPFRRTRSPEVRE